MKRKPRIKVCKYCGETINGKRNYTEHNKTCQKRLNRWVCKYCGETFETIRKLKSHIAEVNHTNRSKDRSYDCQYCDEKFDRRWKLREHVKNNHFDITKRTSKGGCRIYDLNEYECPFCKKKWTTNKGGYSNHINHCYENPNHKTYHERPPLSMETRKKMSEARIKVLNEGRGLYLNSTKKSYPEQWMTDVIENEFTDKDYEYNFRVSRFQLDFAWPKKMRYIEIDGDQHYQYQYNIDKDKRRSEFLKGLGWTELRLSWSFIQRNKKESVNMMKSFIDDVSDLPVELQYKDTRKEYYENLQKSRKENPDKINSVGKYNPFMLTKDDLDKVLESLSKSGIDITKFGWKSKLCRFMEISKRRIDAIIRRFPDYFIGAHDDKHKIK